MAIDTKAIFPLQDPGEVYKYIYRLKFCEIDRFSSHADKMHLKCNKMLKWVEHEEAEPNPKHKGIINSTLRHPKRKFLKFPLKYKYLKQDLVLEISAFLDLRPKNKQNQSGDQNNDSTDS